MLQKCNAHALHFGVTFKADWSQSKLQLGFFGALNRRNRRRHVASWQQSAQPDRRCLGRAADWFQFSRPLENRVIC